MPLYVVTHEARPHPQPDEFFEALKNLNAQPLNETSWLLDLSTNFPHTLGEALAGLLGDGTFLSVSKVDGLPFFFPASEPLAAWAEQRYRSKRS